jgi:tRNA threonylcarbamoyladenosine dehydratase
LISDATSSRAAPAHEERVDDADFERRFGGLRRLHGAAGYARLRQARVAVVGVGGVGSWAVEALARCGVAALVLIDLDHVSESNINRQIQALDSTLGQAKTEALRQRIGHIHPGCKVSTVEDFVQSDNWPALLPHAVDVLIDACDQVHAKLALAAWGLRSGVPVVSVGAAGGKQRAELVQVADLADVTHDPLLASLRQRLRKALGDGSVAAPAAGPTKRSIGMGLACVFSREAVTAPVRAGGDVEPSPEHGNNLNCHGYGSSVTVTATFGMVAAGAAIQRLLAPGPGRSG